MQKLDFQQTAEFLRNCEDAYILIHQSPDGDCIGSGYSLQAVLRQARERFARRDAAVFEAQLLMLHGFEVTRG